MLEVPAPWGMVRRDRVGEGYFHFFLLHAAKVPFLLQRRSRAERPTVSIS